MNYKSKKREIKRLKKSQKKKKRTKKSSESSENNETDEPITSEYDEAPSTSQEPEATENTDSDLWKKGS